MGLSFGRGQSVEAFTKDGKAHPNKCVCGIHDELQLMCAVVSFHGAIEPYRAVLENDVAEQMVQYKPFYLRKGRPCVIVVALWVAHSAFDCQRCGDKRILMKEVVLVGRCIAPPPDVFRDAIVVLC